MAESVAALVSNTSRFTPVPVRPRLWVQGEVREDFSFFCLCAVRMRVGSFSRWRLGRLIFALAVVCYANARDSEIIASENKFSHIISLPRQSSIATATARSSLDCGDRSTAGSGYKEKFERASLFFVSAEFGSMWGRSVGGGVGNLSALWPGDCCAIQRA